MTTRQDYDAEYALSVAQENAARVPERINAGLVRLLAIRRRGALGPEDAFDLNMAIQLITQAATAQDALAIELEAAQCRLG